MRKGREAQEESPATITTDHPPPIFKKTIVGFLIPLTKELKQENKKNKKERPTAQLI